MTGKSKQDLENYTERDCVTFPGLRSEASKDKAAAIRSTSQRCLQTLLITNYQGFKSCKQLISHSPTTSSKIIFILEKAFY